MEKTHTFECARHRPPELFQ